MIWPKWAKIRGTKIHGSGNNRQAKIEGDKVLSYTFFLPVDSGALVL